MGSPRPPRSTRKTTPSRRSSAPSTNGIRVVPLADLSVLESKGVLVPLLGMATAKPNLAQLRSGFDADAEAAGRNLQPKLALIVERHVVELLSPIDDQSGENVDATSRALWVCRAGQVGSQLQPLHYSGDIDDSLLQHRALARERDGLRIQALEPVANGVPAPGQEARPNAIGLLAETEVETGGLKLRGLQPESRP